MDRALSTGKGNALSFRTLRKQLCFEYVMMSNLETIFVKKYQILDIMFHVCL